MGVSIGTDVHEIDHPLDLLVLAGGFGTRLQSTISRVPKALAPVGGAPFLHLQIEQWIDQGIKSFVFLLHHQAGLVVDFLRELERTGLLSGCKVRCLVEPTPLDTGGAVAYAVEQLALKQDFLVTNADTWLGSGIQEIARERAPAMAVVRLTDTSRYGCVQFDLQNCVTSFTEKNIMNKGTGWINAGLCKLDAKSFIGRDRSPFSLERDIFPAMVARGELKVVALQTDFVDIGVPDDYHRFCRWIESNRKGDLWT